MSFSHGKMTAESSILYPKKSTDVLGDKPSIISDHSSTLQHKLKMWKALNRLGFFFFYERSCSILYRASSR